MILSRRAVLRGLTVAAVAPFLPQRAPGGRLTLVREAEAFWLQAAALAITALTYFTKSDSGLGAMLSNIKELQEETLRLVQNVLIQLGEVQRALAQMPKVMARQLEIHDSYKVQEETESIRQHLAFCEAQQTTGTLQRELLVTIITKATDLARFRGVPYGINGTAAICAPLVAAIDARARKLLDRGSEIRDAVNIYYLPWVREIQSTSPGSLYSGIIETGQAYQGEIATLEQAMPPLVKKHLGKEYFERVFALDPGAPTAEERARCGHYERIVGYSNGACLMHDCDGGPIGPHGARILSAPDRVAGPQTGENLPAGCSCSSYAQIPQTQPERAIERWVLARSEFTPVSDTSGREPGPSVTIWTEWRRSASPKHCERFLVGTSTGNTQYVDLEKSADAAAWKKQFTEFVESKIARVQEYRRSIFALHQLLLAIKESENILIRVVS